MPKVNYSAFLKEIYFFNRENTLSFQKLMCYYVYTIMFSEG